MSMVALLLLAQAPAAIDPLAPLGRAEPPVRAERIVRRGETVTLRIRQGALTISTPARALSDAAAGERVRLVVIATRRTLDAVAAAPGIALLSER
jgi:flagella basal body P-ring formation protein FlgA